MFKDVFIFSIIGSKGANIKRMKKDKNVTKVTSMFFCNAIKIKEQNIKNVINIAKPVSNLIHNGGTLTINKYCSDFSNIEYSNNPYTLNSSINIIDNKDINNNKIKNLKLYRSNKINKNKNNIFNKMNLDISNK